MSEIQQIRCEDGPLSGQSVDVEGDYQGGTVEVIVGKRRVMYESIPSKRPGEKWSLRFAASVPIIGDAGQREDDV